MNPISKRGYFITLEGIDGAGKSTIIPWIKQFLLDRKINFVITREPGGTEIAEKIRAIVLSHNTETMCDDTELLLYFASRAQHLNQIIKPALQKGHLVLSDRFTDATYAYQGAGRGMDIKKISTLENLVQGDLRPDLVLILDIDPKEGLLRLAGSRSKDRFEVEQLDFFHRARDFYLNRAKQNPDRYKIIDSNKPPEEVAVEANKLISALLEHYA